MAYQYSVDAQRRLVTVRLSGPLTRSEALSAADTLRDDPRIAPDFMQLIDLLGVTSIAAVTNEDVRMVATASLDQVARRAIVASDAATFGLARMFASLRELREHAEKIAVFHALSEAEEWLGVKKRESA